MLHNFSMARPKALFKYAFQEVLINNRKYCCLIKDASQFLNFNIRCKTVCIVGEVKKQQYYTNMKITIKQDPKSQELFKKMGKLIRPGWGYLDLSSEAKDLAKIDKDYFDYISGIVYSKHILESGEIPPHPEYLLGVSFNLPEETLDSLKEYSGKHTNQFELAQLKFAVKRGDGLNQTLSYAIRIGYYFQTIGVIPIFCIQFPEETDLGFLQQVLARWTYQVNQKKMFLQGLLVQLQFVKTGDKLEALKNLIILRRTIPPLIPSFVIRMDKDEGKTAFDMSFLKKMKLPWIIGFSLSGIPSKEIVEKRALNASGIDE